MQIPTANFNALREAAGNHITHKCVIEVGNFALASKGAFAVASSQQSADWPARGVIDGDRTHINAGPAASAENGLGQSVWQGTVVSAGDGSLTPGEFVHIDLGQIRRVNRIKIIFWPANTKNGNLGTIGAQDFLISKWDGNLIGYGGGGYGGGGYGGVEDLEPWTGLVDKCAEIGKAATSIVNGQVTGNTNDMVVFEDPTPQNVQTLQISISKLQAAGVTARIVAIELTLAVDVTDTVAAISRKRKKDYHLNRRQATQMDMTFRNFDGRFNDRLTPSAAQISAGFFNPFIRPNLEMRYFAGFSGVNVQMFTGFLDMWEPDGNNRIVRIQARDYFKFLIKPNITTKLKTNQSLEFLVELVANYQNFPSNLMILDTTTISPGFFMPKDLSIQRVLNDLQDATGNAEIFLDEFGRLNFRSYLTVIKHQWFQGNPGDFAGWTSIDGHTAVVNNQLVLAQSSPGVYYQEGNAYSPISPVLAGKVEFTTFVGAVAAGLSGSINLFLRVTNDGGVTFTPWREILPNNAPISKWNHWYGQIQVWAQLRTGDTSMTPALISTAVKYNSRGGSNMVHGTPDWAMKDKTTILTWKRRLTDQVGGENYMVSKSLVKSTPTFVSAGVTQAWQGTNNGNPISPTNPLFVAAGTTTIQADFGNQPFNAPQTLNMTLGSATATAMLSSDPNKPTITITTTIPGTIVGLTITGNALVQNGTVQAESDAPQEIFDDFGPNIDTLQNDYIDNVDLAQSIADNTIAQFGQGPLDWLAECAIRFSPNAQINDRVTVTDAFSGIADDYVVIGLQDDLTVDSSGKFDAKTTAELIKIGKTGFAPTVPAYYGNGGLYYYDNFRFGGNFPL